MIIAGLFIAVASVVVTAEPPADLLREVSAFRGSASAAGTLATATTPFTRLRDQAEEIGDIDRDLFMAILGDCLSSGGIAGDVPDCTEFDAKDLATRMPAARQQLRGKLLRWSLSFEGPVASDFILSQYDFRRRVFPVVLKGKLCIGFVGDRCVVPSNSGLVRIPPQFEVRFDVSARDEALARAIAALRPDQPGMTWSPTVEVIFAPTGRVAPQAFRKKLRVEDWIEARLVALRIVVAVPASVAKTGARPTEDVGPDDEGVATSQLVEIVLADYYFK